MCIENESNKKKTFLFIYRFRNLFTKIFSFVAEWIFTRKRTKSKSKSISNNIFTVGFFPLFPKKIKFNFSMKKNKTEKLFKLIELIFVICKRWHQWNCNQWNCNQFYIVISDWIIEVQHKLWLNKKKEKQHFW